MTMENGYAGKRVHNQAKNHGWGKGLKGRTAGVARNGWGKWGKQGF